MLPAYVIKKSEFRSPKSRHASLKSHSRYAPFEKEMPESDNDNHALMLCYVHWLALFSRYLYPSVYNSSRISLNRKGKIFGLYFEM